MQATRPSGSPRAMVTRAIAVTAASAMAAAIAVPPAAAAAVRTPAPTTEHTYNLSASELAMPLTLALPTSIEQLAAGIIPSFGHPVPTPPPIEPVVAPTNANSAVKNIYYAVEPWVRWGFELATYAVGWVPYVGWLSGQIMIFYNFGERIVRSITFNVDDWLLGPLPFVQGLRNVAQDSWNALVQLGIDQWNFWFPPLPPRPPLALAADNEVVAEDNAPTRLLNGTQGVDDGTTPQELPEAAPAGPEGETTDQSGEAIVPDVVDGTTDVVDDKTDVVDDKTDVVDDTTDVVDGTTDVVDDKTDVVDDNTDVVDDTTDVVDDNSDVKGDDADVVSGANTDESAQQSPDAKSDANAPDKADPSSTADTPGSQPQNPAT